ncbi:LuxR C-terminal-related transcriptional regulator [Nocardioides sp. AE5]|uniref:helix-turn-helix transcriptional regulator n=1 Tax=Nocardioides sp. AE5 TaxID=2962573 RepID=UPI002880D375|nr:LuxR C-terminal-related transcriptional regulator [Nocardioides sp. AE5]MDT0203187.1 LuxR C-terminal-related transcriptional regulator [Nocardioides sp. AE5]
MSRSGDEEPHHAPSVRHDELVGQVRGLLPLGGVLIIEGEPGIGKTWGLQGISAHFGAQGAEVVSWSRYEPTPDSSPRSTPPQIVLLDDADLAPRGPALGNVPLPVPAGTVVVATRTCGRVIHADLSRQLYHPDSADRTAVVVLKPLDKARLTKALGKRLTDQLSPEQVNDIVVSSAGNPLVARHIAVRMLGVVQPGTDGLMVSRMLTNQSDAVRSTARIVATLRTVGPEDLGLIVELTGQPRPTVAEHIDTMLRHGLLRQTESEARWHIRHPWLASALRDELGPVQRTDIHRAAALHLRERGEGSATLLAEHLLAYVSADDPAGVTALISTADKVCGNAPSLAVTCYRRALELLPDGSPKIPETSACLARAYLLAGRAEEAVQLGRAALLREQSGAAPDGSTPPWLLPVLTEAMKVTAAVAEAGEMLSSGRTRPTGPLQDAQAAYLLTMAGRHSEARSRIDKARASVDLLTPREQVNVLTNVLHSLCVSTQFNDAWEEVSRLERIVLAAPADSQLNAYATIAHVHAVYGSPEHSLAAADLAKELLSDETWGLHFPEVLYAQAMGATDIGEWDRALQIAEECDEQLALSGATSFLNLMRHLRVEILVGRGEVASARKVAHSLVGDTEMRRSLQSEALAEIDVMEGATTAAAGRLSLQLQEHDVPDGFRVSLLTRLADTAASSGDRALVDKCLTEIDLRWGLDGVSRRSRITCRLALGRVDSDAVLLTTALEEAREARLQLLTGRAHLYRGLLASDPEPDLVAAMRIFGQLEAIPWRRSTAAELRSRGLKVPRRPRNDSENLTETEVQLARLVQAAHSNKDIAKIMFLSVKTVEAYLSRLYAKTNCRNRLDLARALDEGRLKLDGPERQR